MTAFVELNPPSERIVNTVPRGGESGDSTLCTAHRNVRITAAGKALISLSSRNLCLQFHLINNTFTPLSTTSFKARFSQTDLLRKSSAANCPMISVEASFLMESSDDEKDGAYGNFMPKELGHSLSSNGTKFVDEVLNGQSERCLENFRMDKPVFYKLCDILQGKGLLRHTNRIKIEEQLAIFLFIIGHNLRTRAVQELFRYSGETISRHFNNVLNAIMAISLEFFQPPGSDVPPEISQDPRFYPYFKETVLQIEESLPPLEVEQAMMHVDTHDLEIYFVP
ncbi:hypothetical protein CRYUN_Cryun13aG0057300 [Craigia yunnanensis]